jgi:predicted membrane channel-forming protein YqfA (hemolysin III family)
MDSSTIGIGIIGAIAAAFAQAIAHQVARHYRWRRIPRYVTGITIIALAFAPVLFFALPLGHAAVIYGLFWLIVGASGLATWISYEMDGAPPAFTRTDLEKWADAIAGEHDET